MKYVLFVAVAASVLIWSQTDASIIWTSSVNNCTCKPIESIIDGLFTLAGERCKPEPMCRRVHPSNHMMVWLDPKSVDEKGQPLGQFAMPLLVERGKSFNVFQKPFNVTEKFDLICSDGIWYVQKFPFDILFPGDIFVNPVKINEMHLKHQLRHLNCGSY